MGSNGALILKAVVKLKLQGRSKIEKPVVWVKNFWLKKVWKALQDKEPQRGICKTAR